MSGNVYPIDLPNTISNYNAGATITPAGRLMHLSGIPGITTNGLVPDDHESQIHLSLLTFRRLIIAAGASTSDIAKLTVYVKNYDPKNPKHRRQLSRFVGTHRPAMMLVLVPSLFGDEWTFEIDATVSADVIILGATVSGLYAAREAKKAGLTCIVLDAAGRLGGVDTHSVALSETCATDVATGWINGGESKIYALAKSFGAEFIDEPKGGNIVYQDANGKTYSYPFGSVPYDVSSAEGKQLGEIVKCIEAELTDMDIWNVSNPALDAYTMEAWLRSKGASGSTLDIGNLWARALFGMEARDVSALWFLQYLKSFNGLALIGSSRSNAGPRFRLRKGADVIVNGLAASLPEGSIRLNCPIEAVVQPDGQPVQVKAAGVVYSGRKVISTVSSQVLKKITFQPRLPDNKQTWIDSAIANHYSKVVMEFETPFWAEKGFCGLAESAIGPATVIQNASIPSDNKHLILGFMAGDPGVEFFRQSEKEQKKKFLAQLSTVFGVDDLEQNFVQMWTSEWHKDPSTGGCALTGLPPGVVDQIGGDALRKPFQSIHFSGIETAVVYQGYLEGAVLAAERAFAEVSQAIEVDRKAEGVL
ncbi:flavin containing amine oxidoreductase [Fusarium albosuccineum]|uniref:Amine oxidase n=1 Tax=Fusarium albosuccineum TaxID=1237068 RepID=A0A8H4L6X2_9HYPO|nr:flavin containing amine oxidoreductase [Fusarium albosuccineum]